MLNSKSFISADFGAGSLKLAEFEINEAGGLRLKQFVIKSLGLEGSQETKREAIILKALQDVIAEHGIKSKDVNICAPGFHVFSKFVKLPPVDSSKVNQIIQYEAQQNVPFPLAEVVWDYQILGTTAGGELEVLLVAIKADIVEGLFRVAETAGLRLQVCDVSPAALCNAFRYNYGDLEDCTMLLDIGAKTSNLLFFEKGKVFSRSINLGANSITQDFANEAKLKFDEADKIKVAEGFVSLGGAYEEPENKNQAAISKIARQFMTRLHIQVNQTLQFYRGQQGGSAPQRLFLSGGASIMPYTAQFFAEKLNVPVEYFNPFRSIQINPAVNLEELARVAHALGEVVGLGLRNLAHCPVELNLMPDSTLRWQSFNQKKPYFIATVLSLVVVAFAIGLLFDKLAGVNNEEMAKLEQTLEPMRQKDTQFNQVYGDLQKVQKDAGQVNDWLQDRYQWVNVITELRDVLIRVEGKMKVKLGADTGIWVEQMTAGGPAAGENTTPGAGFTPGAAGGYPGYPPPGAAGVYPPPGAAGGYPDPNAGGTRRRGVPPPPADGGEGAPPPASPEEGGGAERPYRNRAPRSAGGSATSANANEVAAISLLFRAVSLSSVSPSANTDTAFALETELKASPLFDAAAQLSGQITPDDAGGTFSFGLSLAFKKPLKL